VRAAIALVALIVVACGPSRDPAAVAAAIQAANDPQIQEVRFSPPNFLDDATISVMLVPGASESDATRIWCDVVVPAGGSHDYDPVAVEIYNREGTVAFALEAECP
jgi:hypothetical protein